MKSVPFSYPNSWVSRPQGHRSKENPHDPMDRGETGGWTCSQCGQRNSDELDSTVRSILKNTGLKVCSDCGKIDEPKADRPRR